jgi:hypothetical protein
MMIAAKTDNAHDLVVGQQSPMPSNIGLFLASVDQQPRKQQAYIAISIKVKSQ